MIAAATSTEPVSPARSPSALAVGTVVWLSSELMFFSGLFAGYFLLRSTNEVWPPAGVELETVRAAVFTVVLVASSVTMHGAVVAAEADDRRRALRWLGVTATLGAVFVANQLLEYAQLDFGIDDHAYGSIYYVMTGFHGLHVVGGLIFMGFVAGIVGGRTSRAPAGAIVDTCAYYWHFVDVVWLAMFATIFLIR